VSVISGTSEGRGKRWERVAKRKRRREKREHLRFSSLYYEKWVKSHVMNMGEIIENLLEFADRPSRWWG
jgi:hypothetical protein